MGPRPCHAWWRETVIWNVSLFGQKQQVEAGNRYIETCRSSSSVTVMGACAHFFIFPVPFRWYDYVLEQPWRASLLVPISNEGFSDEQANFLAVDVPRRAQKYTVLHFHLNIHSSMYNQYVHYTSLLLRWGILLFDRQLLSINDCRCLFVAPSHEKLIR